MKAADLRFSELLERSEGHITLKGRRLVVHGIHAMAYLRGELARSVGEEQTRRLFTRYGTYWGRADAAAMKRIFRWDSTEEWLRAGPQMLSLSGAAIVRVRNLALEVAAGHFEMEITLRDSAEAEEHRMEIGESAEPACWALAAYLSGYATHCLGRPAYFVETACRCQPERRVCQMTGRDAESWGEEIAPLLKYYDADDIGARIETLTESLKRQQRELALERKKLRHLEAEREQSGAFVEVRSRSFQKVMDVAHRVARYDTSILITGESGTGKEVLARYIHSESKRSAKPFLAINCGALPEMLLESELFGHRRGSFTGATEDRPGLFERASEGTLFLDEVGEMPPAMQVKLLRALQEREVTRVGESTPRKINIRLLAATNRDLRRAITEGRFREDLFYRLTVVEITIPPLRERPEDILPIARRLMEAIAKDLGISRPRLDSSVHDFLLSYHWPGNIRELRNTLEQATLMSVRNRILPENLPRHILHPEDTARPGGGSSFAGNLPLAEVEKRHILTVLETAGGNRAEAARILGISPATLWRRMRAYENDSDDGSA